MKPYFKLPGNGKVIISSLAILWLFMFTACNDDDMIDYEVSGETEIQNIDCDLAIPDQVKVHAQLFKGDESIGASGNFQSNGPFDLTIAWLESKGEPDGWRITDVTRLDGSDICTRENTCAEGRQCLDMATKPRRAPLNNEINWRIGCTCVGS